MEALICHIAHAGGINDCALAANCQPFEISPPIVLGDSRHWVTTVTALACVNGGDKRPRCQLPTGAAGNQRFQRALAADSCELLETTASIAPVILSALDPCGRILLASGQGHAALGLEPSDILGRQAQEVFADEPEVLSAIHRALQGENLRIELKCRGLVFECNYTAVRSESSELIGVIGAAVDVTGRAAAVAALNDHEAWLRAVVSGAPIILYALDADGIVNSAEGGGLKSLGLLPRDAVGKSIFELCRHQPELLRVARCAAAGQEFSEAIELDGVVLHCHNSPAYAVDGRKIGGMRVAIDITDQCRTTRTLLHNEVAYREIVESVNDGIWRLDANWQTMFVNRRMAEMLSSRPGEMLGRSLFEFIAKESDAFPLQSLLQLRRPLAEPAEIRFYVGEGKELLALVSAAPTSDETGEFSGALLTVSDITKRKRIEEELQRRDAELAHAARLNTLGEFMTGITHEIRQPLHAISTFASACQKALQADSPLMPADLMHWTAQISKQANRVAAIIHRLGRLARRNTDVKETQFSLNDLVQETLEMLASEIRRQKIRLEVRLSDVVPRVVGDDVQIAQVIVNLVRNAMDAMAETPASRRRLSIRTAVIDRNCVELAIEDAGVGFSEDRAEKIFEPFYTTKANGMGIGLAICRSIAQAHRGYLFGSSSPGNGATFCLQLPLKPQSDSDDGVAHRIYRG